jgi:hypothetical protein
MVGCADGDRHAGGVPQALGNVEAEMIDRCLGGAKSRSARAFSRQCGAPRAWYARDGGFHGDNLPSRLSAPTSRKPCGRAILGRKLCWLDFA